MKISATGWTRSVVGSHKVYDSKSDSVEIEHDGTIVISGKSHYLELTGEFRVRVEFTQEDIHALASAANRAPLESKIGELLEEIRDLKQHLGK